ncbi:MAG: hypothetical protein AMXMBFR25_07430 [Lysobacterales bacterium]
MEAAPAARAIRAAPEWIPTQSALRIISTLRFAQAMGDVVLIYGSEGTGKTHAAREYAKQGGRVWLATMTPATAGIVPALEQICAAVDTLPRNGASELHRAIIGKTTQTGGLLVIDEAQHLIPGALAQIAAIHDAAGIGVAMLGNHSIYAKLTAARSAESLACLHSRIGKRLRVDALTPDDVGVIAASWGVAGAGALKTLAEIGRKAGALRMVTKTLRVAQMLADGRAITDADLRAAWRELTGA